MNLFPQLMISSFVFGPWQQLYTYISPWVGLDYSSPLLSSPLGSRRFPSATTVCCAPACAFRARRRRPSRTSQPPHFLWGASGWGCFHVVVVREGLADGSPLHFPCSQIRVPAWRDASHWADHDVFVELPRRGRRRHTSVQGGIMLNSLLCYQSGTAIWLQLGNNLLSRLL